MSTIATILERPRRVVTGLRARVSGRRRTLLVVGAGLALVAVVAIAAMALSDGGGGGEAAAADVVTTRPIERTDLVESEEIPGNLDYSGTLALDADASGVLIDLADEGSLLERGDVIYVVADNPTDADLSRALQSIADAESQAIGAQQSLDTLLEDADAGDVASAQAAVFSAQRNLEDLLEEPTAGEIAAAEASVAAAREALDVLVDGASEADIASASADVASAEAALDELLAGPSQADIESAEADVAAAQAALDDLYDGASDAEIDAARSQVDQAEAQVDAAESALFDAGTLLVAATTEYCAVDLSGSGVDRPVDSICPTGSSPEALSGSERSDLEDALRSFIADTDAANDGYIEVIDTLLGADSAYASAQSSSSSALASLDAAEDRLAELLGRTPDQTDIDVASARLAQAEETLAELLAPPDPDDVLAAEAALLTARTRLDDLTADPTTASLQDAEARLDQAEEALAELLAPADPNRVGEAQANLTAARARLNDLFEDAPESDLDRAELSIETAETDVQLAQDTYEDLLDDIDAPVLFYGEVPSTRDLSLGDSGRDVAQLQENLAALGYDAGGTMSADGEFDSATGTAVAEWQEATGQEPTGEVAAIDVVYLPGPSQVGEWAPGLQIGDEITAGSPLAEVTPTLAPRSADDPTLVTTQQVAAQLPFSDRELLDVGASVTIELPDDSEVPATVVGISSVPTQGDGTAESSVEVTIALDEPVSTVWIGADVDVLIVEELAADALAVPVTALLALVEGGYAVEVVNTDATTALVGVETGMFADGLVEITGAGLEAGVEVVVP